MMNLWLSCFLLFASPFLSSSAPTPEECQALVTPVSLANSSVTFGRVNLLVGYSDYDAFKTIMKMTDSAWRNISALPISPTEFLMFQTQKINGTCVEVKSKVTVEGDTVTASATNTTSVFHVLPSCKGCLVLSATTTGKNFKNVLKLLKIDSASETDELHTRVLYLFGEGLTLKDSDLEHFKKQASCLGFSGEPDFHYNPEKSFCQEGEGFKVLDSQ
ncbi:uncharacterized protein LOC119425503 [Nematolebias whitei]|uniref:uncharacterized protein LOC119425503 n=1 Tax=Nematolebias whitei TaxID=451745 RepID=UPI00189BF0AB|nr:uncharacterized protein LOC119425503 [Nematolebias whitei]